MRILRLVSPLAVVFYLCLNGAARPAQAYPQWQFSSGTSRCSQCHFSPSGGGLISDYGRTAAGDELSSYSGEGGFLHGAVELPSWLALGGDFRGVLLRHDAGGPYRTLQKIFPMQADVYARFLLGDGISLSVTGGIRGQARKDLGPYGDDNAIPANGSTVESREHYIMWRPSAQGPYLRAGRFFAPYGLRMAEHPTYIRRDVGNNLLQETYGLSGGVLSKDWEVHLTAFVPDFLREFGGREKGAAALYENRFDDYALGLQARVGVGDDATRYGGGAYGKAWIPAIKTLFMAEGDIFHWNIGSGSNQLIGYAGPTIFPFKGVWLAAYGEVNQSSIAVKTSATTAVNGQINWFPYPHFELMVLGRIQSPNGQGDTKTLLLQLHYYL
jgi:hypothetical protein